MTSEDRDFDAGEFFDTGMADAGLDPDPEAGPQDLEPEKVAVPEAVATMESQEKEPEQKAAETPVTERPEANAAAKALESIEASEADQQATEAAEVEEAESVISKLLPDAAEPDETPAAADGQRVPLEAHTKLRKRAQDAERQVAELQEAASSTTPTGAEIPGTEEVSPLDKFIAENPDEDYVPASVQSAQSKWDRAQDVAREQANRDAYNASVAKQQERATDQATATKATTAEQAFRKSTPDYDAVTGAMIGELRLTQEDRVAILATDNPAKDLYDRCVARRTALRAALGVETPASESQQTNTPAESPGEGEQTPEQTDDEIFNEVYG